MAGEGNFLMPQTTKSSKTLAYASFWQRFAAVFLDGIILMVVNFLLGAVLKSVYQQSSWIGTIIGWAYSVYFIGSSGQTPGKKVLNIKVVKADGSTLTYGDAVLREVIGKLVSVITLLIGFLWMLWDPNSQTLHDKIAKTYVVKV